MTSQRGSHFSQQLMAQRSRSHGILTADHFPLGSRALFLLVSFVASLAEEDFWIRKDMFLRCNETGTGDEWRVMVDPGKPGACHQWLMTIQNENLQNGYYLLDFWSRLFLTKALDCFTKIGFWTAQQSLNRQSWHIGTKGTKGALLAIKTEASFHHGNFDHWSRPVVLAADGPRRFANGLPRFFHRGSWFMVVSQAFLGMIKLNPVSRGFQTHYWWQNFPNFTKGGCERDLNIGYIPKSCEASKTFIPSRRVLSWIQIIIGYSRLCLITTHSNEINWGMFDDSCLVWVRIQTFQPTDVGR